ncbi:glycosyltransferase family 2 [Stagonosporopsis vannaccii]|nr:glycosyltransferase family 2 [Stagonosporopsis vannaccii]
MKTLSGLTSPSFRMKWTVTVAVLYTTTIGFCEFSYFWPTKASASIVVLSSAWVGFLMVDYRCKVKSPSFFKALGMLGHVLPAVMLYGTCYLANRATNGADIWFVAFMIFRYWRTLTQTFFYFRYKPVRPTDNDKMKPKHCTVVIPTVGPAGNAFFEDLVASILTNAPARVVFSTNTKSAAEGVENFLKPFLPKYEAGATDYQQRHRLPGTLVTSKIEIIDVGWSSKRRQIVAGLICADTPIIAAADDTAEWSPVWLIETLAAFNDPKVGLVGTRKRVKKLPAPAVDHFNGVLYNAWLRWYARFWNNMGGVYLIRHNFEIQSTNAADGGVFCISGRSCLIRKEILTDEFQHAFTNEFVLGCGPVQPDDDNFITRWVLKNGWEIKVQCQKEATMTTVLGAYPTGFKFFPSQCQRWSRSTLRQNPIALFIDRDIWWTWPITVWTTYFPWMYNAALVWDSLALVTFTQTTVFAESVHPWWLLLGLFYFMQLTKLVKTSAWWWAHPKDFLMYFVFPAYPFFTYRHSIMKIHTAFTCLDMEWSGRTLPAPEKKEE